MITGPTFEEMLHPEKIVTPTRQQALQARQSDPLDPINLFNITWRDAANHACYLVIPPQLTGVDAPIVMLYAREFPSGSHKVGAAYSVLLEKQLFGEVDPNVHTLVWPSTGNYGIGGAWIGSRMGYKSLVLLPAGMSKERFDLIQSYGAQVTKTPGSESNVKEIYDETHRLRASDPNIRILNQFEVMGNYRFHYHVTGNTIAELATELAQRGIGSGKVSAFVSAMGSAGTIAAGDRLKQIWPDHKIVGLEPIQCSTLYDNGYGAHDIEGIGDKHVTWIHNVWNMDALMCIDDQSCKKILQVFAEEGSCAALIRRYGVEPSVAAQLGTLFGISSMCNLIGAIKTARYYHLGKDDLVVTIATDGIDRYYSVVERMAQQHGTLDEAATVGRVESILRGAATDWILRGTPEARERWHNLKYYTWVEQQGKTVEELDAQRGADWWLQQQALVPQIDARLLTLRHAEMSTA